MSRRAVNIMAACFRTLPRESSIFFRELSASLRSLSRRLKDDFKISLAFLACVKMIFVEKFMFRRRNERTASCADTTHLSMSAMLMISLMMEISY